MCLLGLLQCSEHGGILTQDLRVGDGPLGWHCQAEVVLLLETVSQCRLFAPLHASNAPRLVAHEAQGVAFGVVSLQLVVVVVVRVTIRVPQLQNFKEQFLRITPAAISVPSSANVVF